MKRTWFLSILAAAALALIGCDKSTDAASDPILEEDAATAIAGAISEDGGGAADQLADVASISTSGGLSAEVNLLDAAMSTGAPSTIDTLFVPADTSYIFTINRSRANLTGTYVSLIYRMYYVKFINKNGTAQRRYIVSTPAGNDTARTMLFRILYGRGYHRTPIRVHRLDSLAADWIVTNLNTPVVTVNGSYYRAGNDTLRTRNAERTHANTFSATFTNVTRPRRALGGTADAISGTISGTYTATITFARGDLYKERSINKTFTVELSGDDATVNMNGKRFRSTWRYGEMFGQMR